MCIMAESLQVETNLRLICWNISGVNYNLCLFALYSKRLRHLLHPRTFGYFLMTFGFSAQLTLTLIHEGGATLDCAWIHFRDAERLVLLFFGERD